MMKTEVKETAKKPQTDLLTTDYASVIVNDLLNTNDSMSTFNAINKLKFYDIRLQEMGLRATIKIDTEKIG